MDGGEVDYEVLTSFLKGIRAGGYFDQGDATLAVEIITRDGQDGEHLLKEATAILDDAFREAALV
jgi:hypothetical protein